MDSGNSGQPDSRLIESAAATLSESQRRQQLMSISLEAASNVSGAEITVRSPPSTQIPGNIAARSPPVPSTGGGGAGGTVGQINQMSPDAIAQQAQILHQQFLATQRQQEETLRQIQQLQALQHQAQQVQQPQQQQQTMNANVNVQPLDQVVPNSPSGDYGASPAVADAAPKPAPKRRQTKKQAAAASAAATAAATAVAAAAATATVSVTPADSPNPADASAAAASRKRASELLTEEEKKANHIASEQKRRQNIRQGYEKLVTLVPTLSQSQRSEALILQKTVEYIKMLLQEREHLEQQIKDVEASLSM
ncbi:hypothetical protein GQ42DRAFT_165906 [Ramicandelaber brevisporus]|nr:hypothetical protein GQ42DRAFT_165906 [Ramicandelaber brevisporus]